MKTQRIYIPTVAKQHPNPKNLIKLFKIYLEVQNSIIKDKHFVFDFGKCNFFANHACVFIGGLDRYLMHNGAGRVGYPNFKNEAVFNYLKRLGFFVKEEGWTHLPYSDFSLQDIRRKRPYEDIERLLNQDKFPFRDPAMRLHIQEKIGELFLNVDEHSESYSGATASAQYYPEEDIFRFALVDFGVGIAHKICSFVQKTTNETISECEALIKAFTKGFSTKVNLGGLGLKEIKSFVLQNRSMITILCNRAIYQYNGQTDSYKCWEIKSDTGFTGTFVVLDFDAGYVC